MTKDRGFNKLKGKTVKAVDAGANNQVLLLCDDGTVFEINAENNLSSPIITLERQKKKLESLPKREKTTSGRPFEEEQAWPFPKNSSAIKKAKPEKEAAKAAKEPAASKKKAK